MTDLFQILLTTLVVGSLYALLALGYTLVYGVLRLINFAHGDVFVFGAWSAFTIATVFLAKFGTPNHPAPLWILPCVLVLVMMSCAVLGWIIERCAYRPLRGAPRLNTLITAMGVSLLLQNIGQLKGFSVSSDEQGQNAREVSATFPFGPTPRSMPELIDNRVLNHTLIAEGESHAGSARGQIKLDAPVTLLENRQYTLTLSSIGQNDSDTLNVTTKAGTFAAMGDLGTQPRRDPAQVEGRHYQLHMKPLVPIRLLDVVIVCTSLVLMVGLQQVIFRTRLGMAMRAVSHSIPTAALMGINPNRIIAGTLMIGSMLAGAAGVLYGMRYVSLQQPASTIWTILGLNAFVAAIVGGIGNIYGAVLGAFLIAAIEFLGEFFGSQYLTPGLKDVYIFGVLILVLVFKPSGILGKSLPEKV